MNQFNSDKQPVNKIVEIDNMNVLDAVT